MKNVSSHPEGKNKERTLHRPREAGSRQIRARHLFRADAGKSNDQMENSSYNGAKTDTSAGINIEPPGDLRDEQKGKRIAAPANGNQEATGHPGGQPEVPESKRRRETMKRN